MMWAELFTLISLILKLATLIAIFSLMDSCCCEMQRRHYDFIERQQEQKDVHIIEEKMETKLCELDDLKKRVDGLSIKAGFKL